MTDATHVPAGSHALSNRLGRLFTAFARLGTFDQTRRALCHLSETDDATLAARGVTREALVRRILAGRGFV